MGTANYIGRVGAWTVALGIRNVRHTATRVTVSIGVAILVVTATVVSTPIPTVSPGVKLSADSTALILGGSSVPTPDDYYIETVKSHLLAPTHPGQNINYVAVTAPMEVWPLTGIGRLVWLALGPPSIWGPGGPGWPDEPWWKLSGLFDLTIDQSVRAGVADLEQAMAAHGNDNLVIYGYSQGAMIANREKRKLAEQYPEGTKAPDIDFVLSGDPNVPNGGLLARFPGLYVPILDLSFNGPEPTDTPFHTDVITRQYDGLADFPLYPINGVSLLNAVLGVVYVHPYDLDVSLPADPTKSPAYQGTHGDTSYYFFQNPDLPLFAPLRTLGVPESLIDVVEPFFRVLVELGYDRSIPPWEPTPARLIPHARPGQGGHRSRQRDRRGRQQRRGPRRLATTAEPSRAGHSCGTGHRNRQGGHPPAGDVEGHADPNRADDVYGSGDGNPADVDGHGAVNAEGDRNRQRGRFAAGDSD